MPSGIILSSGSQGATKEAIEKVLTDNGYEADKPEVEEKAEEEPKEAGEQEPEEVEGDAEPKEAEEKKPSRRQRAIEKATKELREEVTKLRAELAKVSPKAEAKVEEAKAPKREDFTSDEDFDSATFDYRYKLRRAKEQAEEAKRSLETRLETNFNNYKSGVAAFKEAHDDFDEVVNQPLNIPEAVYYAIVDLGKDGAAVTYHLGKNPEIIDDLAELTPYAAAIEVGRLADKLNKPKTNSNSNSEDSRGTPKPKAKIPEPVKPLGTSPTNTTLTSRDAATARNYKGFKAAQRAGR